MKLKPGVKLLGIRPELNLALMVANSVFERRDLEMTVTSVVDGKHSSKSLHYRGQAADLRSRDVPEDVRPALLADLKGALPTDFDVILEADHYHLEWDPSA